MTRRTHGLEPLRLLTAVPLAVALASTLFGGACGHAPPHSTGNIQAVAGVDPDEHLGVDDVLEVRVAGEAELTGLFRVAADGSMDYPYVGRLTVVGMQSGDLQRTITKKLKDGYIKNPQVSVMVREWNSRKISVLGQVQKQGSVAYFPRMTIVDAIAAAGGFTGIAAKTSVTLRREQMGSVQTITYPVADISDGRSPNIPLVPGDVLVIEERLF
jgi:protein involved in polysaccharide export with SLBB domain